MCEDYTFVNNQMNTHGKKLEIRCERSAFNFNVNFWIWETQWSPERVTRAIATPLIFRTLTKQDECLAQVPAFTVGDESAQAFMDELWRAGFRPTEGSGSAGSLAATERHLQDMRALVFKITPAK